MKVYEIGGYTVQFEEGEAPEGAVEVKQKQEQAPRKKAATPRNKAAKAENK